jgi:hypothetical protein
MIEELECSERDCGCGEVVYRMWISTHSPYKWEFVDTETGQTWIADQDKDPIQFKLKPPTDPKKRVLKLGRKNKGDVPF